MCAYYTVIVGIAATNFWLRAVTKDIYAWPYRRYTGTFRFSSQNIGAVGPRFMNDCYAYAEALRSGDTKCSSQLDVR